MLAAGLLVQAGMREAVLGQREPHTTQTIASASSQASGFSGAVTAPFLLVWLQLVSSAVTDYSGE